MLQTYSQYMTTHKQEMEHKKVRGKFPFLRHKFLKAFFDVQFMHPAVKYEMGGIPLTWV